MKNTEKIIKKIEYVLQRFEENNHFDCPICKATLREALSLLPPLCEICGGSRRAVSRSEKIYPRSGTKPCPACQAPAGEIEEFVKEAQAIIRMGEKSYEAMRAREGHPTGCEQLLWDACSKLKRACTHLTAQAKQIKELKNKTKDAVLQVISDSNKLQMEAAAKIAQLEAEKKRLKKRTKKPDVSLETALAQFARIAHSFKIKNPKQGQLPEMKHRLNNLLWYLQSLQEEKEE